MRIVLFTHPAFFKSQSMPRFAHMLLDSLRSRGHRVEAWAPQSRFYKLMERSNWAKWGGYIDQYVLFPAWVRQRLKHTHPETLFVFCDQALGPWVPLVKNRPHVVHAHDLLALRSALGDCRENPTALAGRLYQRYIRRGFKQAKHFISVSKKTRDDLHRFGQVSAVTSEVVYSGLNFPYAPLAPDIAKNVLASANLPVPPNGMILHVGGGQWYKNLPGVISIYSHYARQVSDPLPLWCIAPQPNEHVTKLIDAIPSNASVTFFSNIDNSTLQAAYSHARLLLFPSLAEGFGWPLVEALACACPVVTSNEAPMTEFAKGAAHFIPRLEFGADMQAWAATSAEVVLKLLSLKSARDALCQERARRWSQDFSAQKSIDAYVAIYQRVCSDFISNSDGSHAYKNL